METLKTITHIASAKKLIIDNFGDKTFTSISVCKLFALNGVHHMNFYHLFYAGCVDRVSRGKYNKTMQLKQLSPSEIYALSIRNLNKKRDNKLLLKKIKEDVGNEKQSKLNLTNKFSESECISFLKNLGYKIMKPVSQFEEV